jgi:hypothetical protein
MQLMGVAYRKIQETNQIKWVITGNQGHAGEEDI